MGLIIKDIIQMYLCIEDQTATSTQLSRTFKLKTVRKKQVWEPF